MSTPAALQFGQTYHIYNRGNNSETVFRREQNYHYFMQLCARHVYPVVDTLAYVLLPNHYHLLVRVKTKVEILEKAVTIAANDPHGIRARRIKLDPEKVSASQCFGNLFNAYTKAINKIYQRTGSLFEKPFHRIPVTNKTYFQHLVLYIHYNPQIHGLIDDYRLWPFSSYPSYLADQPTRVQKKQVLAVFGGREAFIESHRNYRLDKGVDLPY